MRFLSDFVYAFIIFIKFFIGTVMFGSIITMIALPFIVIIVLPLHYLSPATLVVTVPVCVAFAYALYQDVRFVSWFMGRLNHTTKVFTG